MTRDKNIPANIWIKEFIVWLGLGVLAGPAIFFIFLAYETYTPDLLPQFVEKFFLIILGLPLLFALSVGGNLGWAFCEPSMIHTFGCGATAGKYFVIPFYIIYLPFLYWIFDKTKGLIKKHKKE